MQIARHSLALIAVALILCLFLIHPFLQYSRPKWPAIKEPGVLIEDCKALLQNPETGDVPPNMWSKSIKELRPVKVTVVKDDYVEIIVSKGGISTPVGYLIFANSTKVAQFSIPGAILNQTNSPLILKFQ